MLSLINNFKWANKKKLIKANSFELKNENICGHYIRKQGKIALTNQISARVGVNIFGFIRLNFSPPWRTRRKERKFVKKGKKE